MSMVIKRNVLKDTSTALKLVKIDMTDKENQLDAVSTKFGTALKDMLSVLGAADVKIHSFKKECKDSVQGRIQVCFDSVQPLWAPKKTAQIFL